ncbi:hypothetical protein ACS0TY_034630 [Phlomoides rotata]
MTRMACEAVQMWSLSGLVAAFLDLAVAYLLLCASAVVYLASKFLGFFGLNLPCPCDGMFINTHNKALCFNRLLIDFPTQNVSDIQLCVKRRFPFSYSECPKEYGYSISGDNSVTRIVKIEGEASCSSVSDEWRSVEVIQSEMGNEKYDVKGKGVSNRRPRSRLRRRRGGGDHGKNSLLLCYDPPLLEEVIDGEVCSKFSMQRGSGFIGDASLPVDNGATHNLEFDNKAPKKKRGRQRAVTDVEMNESHDEDVHLKKNMQSTKELRDNQQGFQGGDDKDTLRLLEQKLKEEHIARAVLYIELEKERSAAATAADEAMAMILRLQEEKASIEIEARQYQRILEEKSVYDAEEMSILKEILVRREMEKHFLEKEVEAYRQTVSVASIDGSDKSGVAFGPLLDPNDEQFSFDKNRDLNENSVEKPVCNLSEDVGLQVKDIAISNWNNQFTSKAPLYPEHVQETSQVYKINEKIIETCNGNEMSDQSLKKQEKDAFLESSNSCDPTLDTEPHVSDLHIIGEDSSSIHRDQNSVLTEDDVKRISRGLPPVGRTRRGLSLVRRSSASAMDNEMLKINSEIGRLRERLMLVQEGREKLGLCSENRERENVQLTLLEEIAQQVQEIRRLTEPGKAARHASLPLPTSKVLSKKRRSKSVSSGLEMSSEDDMLVYRKAEI